MHLFKRADGFYVIVYLLCETLVEHPTRFVEASQKRRSSKSEQYYRREADWKEAGERAKRTSERAGILSDLLLARAIARVNGKSAIYYIISVLLQINSLELLKKVELSEIWLQLVAI